MPRARASAVGLRTINDENRQLTTDASFENWRQRRCRCNADDAHDAMMMRQKKIDTRRKRKEKGNLLGRRHRAVTGSLKAKQVCMQEPLNIVTNIFYLDPKKKKTIYTGKLPTSKRRKYNIFGFFSN